MMSQGAKLKARLSRSEIIVIPGVYDALSALIAEQAAMEAVFLSGSAMSYSQLGRPDVGLVTMSEMVDACARITDRIDIPVLVDVDSGFGNAAHAARTIRALEQAGAAAVQMEDQLPINPVNDLKGRPLIRPEIMADKIKAMADARRSETTLISARSDAPASEPLGKTIERISLYKEAGADILFAEGLTLESEVSEIVKAADGVPVLFNLLRGDTALKSAPQLEALGVSIALFPGNAILSVGKILQDVFAHLKVDPQLDYRGFPLSGKDLNALLGTPEMLAKFKDFSG